MHRPARDYQIACVDAIARCINTSDRRTYYALPTGTGKTRIMTMLVDVYRHTGRILVIAHRKELIEQTAESIKTDVDAVDVGIVMSKQNDIKAEIVVGTWQSLTPLRLETVLTSRDKHFSLILIDEAHHCIKNSAYERIIEQLEAHSPRVAVVGATATPFRSDKARMQEVLPECAFNRTISEMQTAGWLAPVRWQAIKLSMDFSKIKRASIEGEEDYNQDELYQQVSPQTMEIVKKTAIHFSNRPAMIFAINVQHAEELSAAYQAAGIETRALSAKSAKSYREETLQAWKAGEIQAVVNVALFTEGFDYTPIRPNNNGLGVVVNAAPTKSPSRYLQMVGRGTRLKPAGSDFKDCLVFDVAGNANLLETKQILLPKVSPTLQEDLLEKSDEFVDFNGEEEDAKLKPPTQLRINDPLATSWLPWGHNIPLNVYFASLRFEKKSSEYAVIIPSERNDGLYRAFILTKDEKWHGQAVTSRAKPLQELMHHMNHVIATTSRNSFVHKSNQKRLEMPSPAQLAFLERKAPDYHKAAIDGGWNKGQVSSMITWLVIQPIVIKLKERRRKSDAEDIPTQTETSSDKE